MSVSGFAELLLLLGCAPLQDGRYLGEPLLEVEGEILQQISLSELEGEPTAAVIWTPGATGGPETPPEEREPPIPLQHEQVWVRTSFPANFQLQLFDDPPDEALHEDRQGAQLASGTVVLFMDLDGDGLADWGEEGLVGAADNVLLHWRPDSGYELILVPMDCEGPDFEGTEQPPDDVDIVVAEDVCEVIVDPDCESGSAEWGEDCAAHEPPPR